MSNEGQLTTGLTRGRCKQSACCFDSHRQETHNFFLDNSGPHPNTVVGGNTPFVRCHAIKP